MKILLLVFVFFLTLRLTSVDVHAESPDFESLSTAYGFLVGQEFTLQRIEKNFPNLAQETKEAWFSFESSPFAESGKAIEQNLAKQTGQSSAEMKEAFVTELVSMVKGQTLSQEQAVDFLAMVKARANGEMLPSVRETLLLNNKRYAANPSLLMSDGFKETFSSRGLFKAKGVKMKISYPMTWKATDGARPNIFQKFVGKSASGLDVMTLTARTLPNEIASLNATEQAEILSLDVVKELLGESVNIESYDLTKLDAVPTAMVEFSTVNERAGLKIGQRGVSFLAIRENVLVIIQIATGGDASDGGASLSARYKKMKLLYRSIATSVVFVKQWEEEVVGKAGEPLAGFIQIHKGGLKLQVPKEMSSMTVERNSGEQLKSLEKYTSVSGTRSMIIKHFVFNPPFKFTLSEAADLTEADLRSQPEYKSVRQSMDVSGLNGLLLRVQYQGMGQEVDQSILFFTKEYEYWEIHVFGVSDKDSVRLQKIKDAIFSSVEIEN